MATQTIVTRIKNKVDTLSAWQSYTGTLLNGEIAVVRVPTGETYTNPVTGADEPVIELLMKVGDGTSTFAQLPWMSAKASDVYDWAKAVRVEFNTTDNKIYFKRADNTNIASIDLSSLAAKISALESGKLSDITVTADGTTGVVKNVEKDGTGKIKVTRATVATADIASSAVTTAKIADSNVTTAKVADGAITNAKLGTDISSDKINIAEGETTSTLTAKLSSVDAALAGIKSNFSVSPASATSSGVVQGVTYDNATGVFTVTYGTATSSDLGSNSVITAKIKDANVTSAKLATGAVTTAKIADEAVTDAKIASISSDKVAIGTGTTDGMLSKKLADMDASIAANTDKLAGHTDAAINTLIDTKINALDVSAPSASGTGTAFITSVSQTNGKISATKASLPTASSSTAGITKLGATGGAATYDSIFGSDGKGGINKQVETNTSDIASLKTAVSGGVHFIGTVTAKPTTSSVKVNGSTTATTAVAGDIVIWTTEGIEYIYTGSIWEELGDVDRIGAIETKISGMDYDGGEFGTSKFVTKVTETDGVIAATYAQPVSTDVLYASGGTDTVKTKIDENAANIATKANSADVYTKTETDSAISTAINALDYSSPSASSTTTSFIDTVKQTNGKISATKKTITSGSTSAKGIVQLSSAVDSTSEAYAATPKAVKTAYDKAVDAEAAAAAAQEAAEHSHDAYVNQNAFSNIKVGDTTVASTTATDTIEFAGSNVTFTTDATNKKITFKVASGSTSTTGIVKLNNSTASTSTSTAATANAVKLAYDKGAEGVAAAAAIAENYVKVENDNLVTQSGNVIIFDCGGAAD